MSIFKHLDAKHISNYKFKLNHTMNNDLQNKYVLIKKNRKKTILSQNEKCQAIINNGNQCSRRKKYGEFCGKHKIKQPFGIVDKQYLSKIKIEQKIDLNDQNLLEVKKFRYKENEYLIDSNKIIFNRKGTEIIGKLNSNNEIYLI